MSGNDAFVLLNESGWRRGLRNLMSNEFAAWWKTRMWWVQMLIWGGIIGFMLAAVIFQSDEGLPTGAMLYSIFGGLFPSVAVIIIMQEAVVGEKQSGTAAWVLSKPVSRPAFILSKLASNSVGVLVNMVVAPGLVAYIVLSIAAGRPLGVLNFLAAMLVLWLVQLYFLSFTLMLGTIYSNRGPVIGFALGLLFVQQYIVNLLPFTGNILPWSIVIPTDGGDSSFISRLVMGQPVDPPLVIALIAVQIVLFVIIGIRKFSQEEF